MISLTDSFLEALDKLACNPFEAQQVIRRVQRAYDRMHNREFRKTGASWPIIPDRRWDAEPGANGGWIVSGYESSHDDEAIVKWRITPADRLIRLKPRVA